ncbi:MAG: hydroxyacid dehydrogenase [Verrucomicrobiota bacterium]
MSNSTTSSTTSNRMNPDVRPKALYILDPVARTVIYGLEEQGELKELADFCGEPQSADSIKANLSLLSEVEVIFSGWGAPVMDEAFLAAAPKLRAVFYGAGTIRYFMTPAFWKRNIAITCAADANAIPVAEFTQAAIVLSLKKFWSLSATAKQDPTIWKNGGARQLPGCFRSTVGFISLGAIAKKTLEFVRLLDVKRLVYSRSLTEEGAAQLNVTRATIDEIFSQSDVVSLHTPDLPSTRGMIKGRHFEMMKPGATFINTARGAVVNEGEMAGVLQRRPDLTALLDVVYPEPPASDSLLLKLPNVILTPHIAGSTGPECQRLGNYMLQEFRRYLAGEPLKWEVTEETVAGMA